MQYIILLTVLILAALAYAFFVEPRRLVVRRFKVRFSQDKKNLTVERKSEGNGTRVVFFSDLHAGPWFKNKDLERVAARIKSLKPELILFGGDLVTEESAIESIEFKDELVRFFKSLKESAPVVAVFGNHDVENPDNDSLTKTIYREAGIDLLRNDVWDPTTNYSNASNVESTSPFDFSVYGTEEGFWGQATAPAKDFSGIMVCHQPDLVPSLIKESGAILSLSGHTHRGQVTFAGIPIVKVPLGKRYTYGHYVFNQGQALLVSGGVGMVHLPFRFWAPPEVLLLTVESGE